MEEKEGNKIQTSHFGQLLELLTGRQGRKAAFAIWGFFVGTSLRMEDKITGEIWWYVFLTCASLIGFGTVLDKVIEKAGDAVTNIFISRAKILLPPVPPA